MRLVRALYTRRNEPACHPHKRIARHREATLMLPLVQVSCPYCGEPIELAVDDSAGDQAYVEDCPVCCRPIVVEARVDDDAGVEAIVRRDDET